MESSTGPDCKKGFERFGFVASPVDSLTVMITVRDAVKALGEKQA